jgi:hypothetical protein
MATGLPGGGKAGGGKAAKVDAQAQAQRQAQAKADAQAQVQAKADAQAQAQRQQAQAQAQRQRQQAKREQKEALAREEMQMKQQQQLLAQRRKARDQAFALGGNPEAVIEAAEVSEAAEKPGGGGGGGAAVPWACESCTFENPHSELVCSMCRNARPATAHALRVIPGPMEAEAARVVLAQAQAALAQAQQRREQQQAEVRAQAKAAEEARQAEARALQLARQQEKQAKSKRVEQEKRDKDLRSKAAVAEFLAQEELVREVAALPGLSRQMVMSLEETVAAKQQKLLKQEEHLQFEKNSITRSDWMEREWSVAKELALKGAISSSLISATLHQAIQADLQRRCTAEGAELEAAELAKRQEELREETRERNKQGLATVLFDLQHTRFAVGSEVAFRSDAVVPTGLPRAMGGVICGVYPRKRGSSFGCVALSLQLAGASLVSLSSQSDNIEGVIVDIQHTKLRHPEDRVVQAPYALTHDNDISGFPLVPVEPEQVQQTGKFALLVMFVMLELWGRWFCVRE